MTNNKSGIPKLRFPSYTEPWEQRKLGDLAAFSKGSGYSKADLAESGTPLILYGRLYTKYETIIKKVDTFAEEKQGSIFSKGGEVIVPASGETAQDISRASVVESSGFMLGGDLNIIHPKKEIDSAFLARTISNGNQQKELSRRAQGKSIVHIHNEDLKKVSIRLPKKKEQQKIGTFFQQLDNLIALHQRKLDDLKTQKKGLLQKMFPKKGADIPEVRFPGFTGTWEQRKLLDNIENIIDFRGRTPKKLGLDWSSNGYLALSALNVKNGYIDYIVDAHYGNEELYNKWMGEKKLQKGQVLFTTEAPMGNVAQVPDNKGYILSQRTIAFNVKKDLMTNDFLAVLLRSPMSFNELTSLASGGTAKGVSQKSLSYFKIKAPRSIREQQQIGTFFQQLDKLITLHQRKLEHLQLQKKGLLQQMFV